jgi:hypothetical protein
MWYNYGISTREAPMMLDASLGLLITGKGEFPMTASDHTPFKRCTKCGRDLPATQQFFVSNRSERDGLHSYCKSCWREYQAGKRAERRSLTVKIPDGYRVCGDCLTLLPATREYFSTNTKGKDGLQSICKACGANRQRVYRQEHPERVRASEKKRDPQKRRLERLASYKRNAAQKREQKRLYKATHPEQVKAAAHKQRARRRSAPGQYTGDELKALFHMQKGKCWWCGCQMDERAEPDHRIPLSRGGTNDIGNIVWSCFDCNRNKYNKLPHEWNGRLL